ncbi:class I SAM-dependent methyltransferase [Leeuwenhoekiella sp. H156]|uniref:class I SAM-dependent methyltransferase n=1 Tax=Leeuwenhoekiella sp. H156 TaxID=3450128 RepID=UPI003FA41304
MAQVYEKNLWGGGEAAFYSGAGSHDPKTVNAYVEVAGAFLRSFNPPLRVCDLGCGDFNVGSRLVPYTQRYKAVDIVPDLIAYNQKHYQAPQLSFEVLDLAKDPLPDGDCALLRQVLQHLSNAEICAIVPKLYAFRYVILTEHLPDSPFEPNADLISGQGIRLKKQSGVDLLAAPFHLKVKESRELLSLSAPEAKGNLVTTLYTLN